MDTSWDSDVAAFWASIESMSARDALERMHALVMERPRSDPDGLFELASVHDYLGMEAEAIPLYESALAGGLGGERRPQAVIQLASSLRNVGRPEEAVAMLRAAPPDASVGDATQGFLALALHDVGRQDEALKIALKALAVTVPMYQGALARYADELASPSEHELSD